MSTVKQAVNLDFVLGPDLEQVASAANGLGGGQPVASFSKGSSQPFANDAADGAYSMFSVCIIVSAIVSFSLAACILVLRNLIINQEVTYVYFLVKSEMLLELPSIRAQMEFIMFESLVAAWAVLMQYKATMALSSVASLVAYALTFSSRIVTQEIPECVLHWILLVLRPLLVLRFGCIFAYWMDIR